MKQVVCVILFSLFFVVPVRTYGQYRFHNIGREAGLGDMDVIKIRQDSVGYMWFYTPQASFRYDGYSLRRFGRSNDNMGRTGKSIKLKERRQIWSATENDGIRVCDVDGKLIHQLRREDGNPFSLPTNHITCLYLDKDGIVWVGTSKGGVSFYSPDDLRFTLTKLQRQEDASCFWETGDGSMWIGLDGKGIVQVSSDGKPLCYFDDTNSPLSNNSVIGAYRDIGGHHLLATYGGGIYEFNDGVISRTRWGMSGSVKFARKMVRDGRGNLWIGSVKSGLTMVDRDGNHTVYTFSNSALNTNAVVDVVADKYGRVFVATATGLAYVVYDGSRARVLAASSDTSRVSLGRMHITTMAVDGRGLLWVGTDQGLRIYNIKGRERLSFGLLAILGRHNGVGMVRAVTEDGKGNMWVTTDRGIVHVVVIKGSKGCRFDCYPYSIGKGADRLSFAKYALYRTLNGDIVAGTFGKFVRIYVSSARAWRHARKVVITEAMVNGRQVDAEDMKAWKLEQGDDVDIRVSAFDYLHASGMCYLYRLDGSSGWIQADGNRIRIAGVPSGSHTLEIKNGTGGDGAAVTKVDLTVGRPFFSPFVFGLIAVVVCLGVGMYIVVIRRRRNVEVVGKEDEIDGMTAPCEINDVFNTDNSYGADAEFVARATRIVEEHLGDFDFSVEDFSRLMLVSRSSLYKKLLASTGQAPLEFIRKIRLRHGREMLLGHGKTVAEVAYSVGLSPKQFSKFFKKEYGVLPSRVK